MITSCNISISNWYKDNRFLVVQNSINMIFFTFLGTYVEIRCKLFVDKHNKIYLIIFIPVNLYGKQ